MPFIISFRDVSYPDFLEGFSCDIEVGYSVLVITSREEESTTLTRLITGLTCPSRGSILINGQDLAGLGKAELYALRQQIGVVPSHGGLISNLKLWENITLPLTYHCGGITPEEEKNALDYLEQLGYSGNIMALPAHLSPYEKKLTALVRVFIGQPRLALYSDCIEGPPSVSRNVLIRVTQEFHAAVKDRTSLYITCSQKLAADLPVDTVIRIDESAGTISRQR
jgi:ABC-type transporter Mla maintaining outer membrane lipid asymmetry ATPase subunit MlaF